MLAGKRSGVNSLDGIAFLLRRTLLLVEAYLDGIRQGQEHYMNIVRILDLLDPKLRVAIAYLLHKAGGCLVSQRLRGQLVEAVTRLGDGILDVVSQCRELSGCSGAPSSSVFTSLARLYLFWL
ncbi:PREDICTED: ankyrin repeat SKIP35 [Prunus dulcis]|uniref:PREDICTED: ankyrin repeat SKIP35 n=1 Tax=Prunus dulcis TaxID=3755 RepID=A0A5E4ED12_PRUDU|nr:PREDICTED: ankyrin repeat SKIP35 [Prunus dulcis]